jgi:outer membrane lipoprotein
MQLYKYVISLIVVLTVITGCATGFSNKSLKMVNPDIMISDIFDDPYGIEGETVLFGGSIMNTLSYLGESTMEVQQLALDPKLVPIPNATSEGVIIVKFSTHLPTNIYRPGRLITIIGTVIGTEDRRRGRKYTTYPVMKVIEYQLRIATEHIIAPQRTPVAIP